MKYLVILACALLSYYFLTYARYSPLHKKKDPSCEDARHREATAKWNDSDKLDGEIHDLNRMLIKMCEDEGV